MDEVLLRANYQGKSAKTLMSRADIWVHTYLWRTWPNRAGHEGELPSTSGEKDHRHQGQSTGLDGQMPLLYKDCCSAGTEVSDPLKGMKERKSIR